MKKWFTFFALSLLAVGCSQSKHSGAKSENNKLVGLAYTTWHKDTVWQNVWDKPELGYYKSDNVEVIKQHARWIGDAGVDFIFVDWSNNIDYVPGQTKNAGIFDMIENSATLLFEEYSKMEISPKICIMESGRPQFAIPATGEKHRRLDGVIDLVVMQAGNGAHEAAGPFRQAADVPLAEFHRHCVIAGVFVFAARAAINGAPGRN